MKEKIPVKPLDSFGDDVYQKLMARSLEASKNVVLSTLLWIRADAHSNLARLSRAVSPDPLGDTP